MILRRVPARLLAHGRPLLGTALPRYRFGRKTWALVALVVVLLLLPTLFFPLGADQGLYYTSGRKILMGAVHYRDIIDLKPPLIYHLYAIAIALFGAHPVSVRLLDLLVQSATCLFMVQLIRRASGNDLWAACSAIIYAMLYVALSFNSTALAEGFIGVMLLPAIHALLFGRSRFAQVVAGVLVGALALLKFTFAIVLPVLLVYVVWNGATPPSQRARRAVSLCGGFALVLTLLPLYLSAFGVWPEFELMNRFIIGYASVHHGSLGSRATLALDHLNMLLVDHLSVVLTIAVAAALLTGIAWRAEGEEHLESIAGQRRLLRMAGALLLALAATIVLEDKYAPYIFSRIFPMAAVLSAFVICRIAMRLPAAAGADAFRWLLMVVAVPAFLLLGPFPRYGRHAVGGLISATMGDKGFDAYYGTTPYGRSDLRTIASTVRERRRPGDHTFVASGLAGLLYAYLEEVPQTGLVHAAYIMAPYAPDEWRNGTRRYLLESQPRFIALGRIDSMPDLTGSTASSEEAVRALPGIDSLLDTAYDVATQTRWFTLYERTDP